MKEIHVGKILKKFLPASLLGVCWLLVLSQIN
jgi:hypothetical protein